MSCESKASQLDFADSATSSEQTGRDRQWSERKFAPARV